MRKIRALVLLCSTLALGGAAAGQTVTSTYDKEFGLSRLDTYEFAAGERDPSDPLAADTLTEKMIRDALEEELQNSGHHPPPHGAAPSFLVSFHVKVKDQTDGRGREGDYVQGILIVDFHDAGTKRLVWRGIATGAVGREAVDLKLAEDRVQAAAKLLLEQFGRDLLGF